MWLAIIVETIMGKGMWIFMVGNLREVILRMLPNVWQWRLTCYLPPVLLWHIQHSGLKDKHIRLRLNIGWRMLMVYISKITHLVKHLKVKMPMLIFLLKIYQVIPYWVFLLLGISKVRLHLHPHILENMWEMMNKVLKVFCIMNIMVISIGKY